MKRPVFLKSFFEMVDTLIQEEGGLSKKSEKLINECMENYIADVQSFFANHATSAEQTKSKGETIAMIESAFEEYIGLQKKIVE